MSIPDLNHLAQDRHGDLGRCLGADVEPNWPMNARDRCFVVTCLRQPLRPRGRCTPAAHRPDVFDRAGEQPRQQWVLEAGVMTQYHHVGPSVEVDEGHHRVRPSDVDLSGLGKPVLRCERGPAVGHSDSIAEVGGEFREFLACVDGSDDKQPGLGSDRLDIDRTIVVIKRTVLFDVHELSGIGKDSFAQRLGKGAGDDPSIGVDDRFCTDMGSGYDGHNGSQAFPDYQAVNG